MLAGTAAARSGNVGELVSPTAAEAEPIQGTINFWSRETFNNGTREPLINAQAAAFDSAHRTTTSVQFMAFGESITKEQAAIAAGQAPDLAEQGPDVGTQFAAAGNLLDMTQVVRDLQSSFVPLQRDAYIASQGKFFGVPWWSETRVLFYHKNLLDGAGLKPPTTWAEWIAAAQKLTKGDQYGYAIELDGPGPGQLWIPLGISNGGRVIDKSGKIVSDSDSMREALQFVTDFYRKYQTMPAATPTYTRNDVIQLFVLGKIAMLVDNGEVLQTIQQTNPSLLTNIGAVRLPVNKQGQTSRAFLGGFNLFVFAKSRNPNGGLALLRWMYDPGWYTRFIVSTNGAALPVTKATAGADLFRTDELLRPLIATLTTAVRYGGPDWGNTAWTGEAEGKLIFSQPVVDVVNGKKSVDQALMDMTAALRALAKQ